MRYLICCRVSPAKFLLIVFLLLTAANAQVHRDLTLTEIGFNAPDTNSEYIEVFNLSYSNTLDLYNLIIKYGGTTKDTVVPVGMNALLPPRTYAVIFEGDYNFSNGIFNNRIPPGAVVVKIRGNTFGSTGMSNTSDKAITLISPYGDSLETYIYSADNAAGISDEKKDLSKNNLPVNWGNSRYYLGTPGRDNSVSLKQINPALTASTYSPAIIFGTTQVNASCTLKNLGTQTIQQAVVSLYHDINSDTIPSANEWLTDTETGILPPGDSVVLNFNARQFSEGRVQLLFRLSYTGDEDTLDNHITVHFNVLKQLNSTADIVFTEIMPDPGTKGSEWVELFNRTNRPVNLKNWRISDYVTSSVISADTLWLQPGNYLILSKDSTYKQFYPFSSRLKVMNLPQLNNTGDRLLLVDSLAYLIDSVFYSSNNTASGVSLERIEYDTTMVRNNWDFCRGKYRASPGRINSLSPKRFDIAVTYFNYFIRSDSLCFNLDWHNFGVNTFPAFPLNIYSDANGNGIPEPAELIKSYNYPAAAPNQHGMLSGSLMKVSQGTYKFIALIPSADDDELNNSTEFSYTKNPVLFADEAVLINEIQAAPAPGYTEWIELYNNSADSINLSCFLITDYTDTTRLTNTRKMFGPGDYAVISRDSTVALQYKGIKNLIVCQLPLLNNTSEIIRLMDTLKNPVHIMSYDFSTINLTGASYEYGESRNPNSRYWGFSKSRWFGTPGYINTNGYHTKDAAITKVTLTPLYAAANDSVTIGVTLNYTGTAQTVKAYLHEDADSNFTPDGAALDSATVAVSNGAVTSFVFSYKPVVAKTRRFFARLYSPADEDTANNYEYIVITPGVRQGAVKITEIMSNPAAGTPEWIELLNTSSDTLNLGGWSVSDVLTTPASVKIPAGTLLAPGARLVLCNADIKELYPATNAAFLVLSLPALNNLSDGVVLKDTRNLTIDSVFYTYSTTPATGIAYEKLNTDATGNFAGNWFPSDDYFGGTPGRINSIQPKVTDLRITQPVVTPGTPSFGESGTITFSFINKGSAALTTTQARFSIPRTGFSYTISIPALQPAAGYTHSVPVVFSDSTLRWSVNADIPGDADAGNNNFSGVVKTGFSKGSVIISEINAQPYTVYPVWFELYNAGTATVDLKDWGVQLTHSGTRTPISTVSLPLQPGEYAVFSPDTLLHNYYGAAELKVHYLPLSGATIHSLYLSDYRPAIMDSFLLPAGLLPAANSYERTVNNGKSVWTIPLSGYLATPGTRNSVTLSKGPLPGAVIINEIMYDPQQEKPEFVELYNNSDLPVELPQLVIEREGKAGFALINKIKTLNPRTYCIIASDSLMNLAYPQLNSEAVIIALPGISGLPSGGSSLMLRTVSGVLTDSIQYSSSYHNSRFTSLRGRSLERISAGGGTQKTNWSSSVAPSGCTPGYENSISIRGETSESRLSFTPNPFSPDDDGYEDYCAIGYKLPAAASSLTIMLFDSRGRLIKKIADALPLPAEGSVIFDGKDNSGKALPIGQYIIYLEAKGPDGSNITKEKGVVVVARGR